MNKIKKFKDFMIGVGSNIRRSMNHLIVEGTIKSWLFGKTKSFELHIYYTPLKKTIVDVKFYSEDNLTLEQLNPELEIGDSIHEATTWVKKCKFTITSDFSRL